MNILYLIGNGFDLNLGLNTKLSHVIENIIGEETDNSEIIKLKEKLTKYKELWWSDFEFQLGQDTKEFNPKTLDTYDNQYNYFVKKIKNIFEEQENKINYQSKSSFIANSFIKYITSFYNYLPDARKQIVLNSMKKIDINEHINYDFITFNYTTVLDNFVKCFHKEYFNKKYSAPIPIKTEKTTFHFIRNIIHIHGTLKEGLILGVDTKEQIANKKLAKNKLFIPKIIKQETINALGRNTIVEAKELIDNSNIIIAFGLSIGITDKYWWNYIMNWLIKDIDRQFILFIYDDKMDSTLNLTKINTIENAKSKLLSVLDISIQKQFHICGERVHFIFEQKKMFKIDNIFYSTSNETYNTSSHNRFDISRIVNNDIFRNIDYANKALKNITPAAMVNTTPDAIKRIDDLFKRLP